MVNRVIHGRQIYSNLCRNKMAETENVVRTEEKQRHQMYAVVQGCVLSGRTVGAWPSSRRTSYVVFIDRAKCFALTSKLVVAEVHFDQGLHAVIQRMWNFSCPDVSGAGKSEIVRVVVVKFPPFPPACVPVPLRR